MAHNVLIAVPTYESISPDTFKSIWDMDRPCECGFEFVRGYDCARARTNIAEKMLEGGYSHVLMVDSDIVVPGNALVDLLSDDVDVCLGVYARRSGDGDKTCVFRTGQFNFGDAYTTEEARAAAASGEHLVRVKGGGAGCMLVKRGVFEKVRFPWFKFVTYEDGHGVLSEDLWFCQECAKAGVGIYADMRVRCGHMTRSRLEV